jgi:hypothetical protein
MSQPAVQAGKIVGLVQLHLLLDDEAYKGNRLMEMQTVSSAPSYSLIPWTYWIKWI